ncbi:hypothetical protein B9Z19DRAFT_1073797 [Tuber borchii]|uniref:Uncharacterized protein n=1 Tax=Tuber borchii TaxID=42251 RepID=A0A2T7A5B8_TUBBO|nr:hypothetical protein B9Z19DRAFT_1073797 [Tuber borchii]
MYHPTAHMPSACHRAPNNEEELLEGYKYKEQGDSDSESEWDSSSLLRPNLHLLELRNPSSPTSIPKTRKSSSYAKAQEEISPTALEGLALLLTSTGESSEYGHGGNGEEELAVELQNYMCILNDAADEKWEWEKEKYVCILMKALLGGLGIEGEGVQIDPVGTRKREFCNEGEGVREYGKDKRRRILGDEKYLTGRRTR